MVLLAMRGAYTEIGRGQRGMVRSFGARRTEDGLWRDAPATTTCGEMPQPRVRVPSAALREQVPALRLREQVPALRLRERVPLRVLRQRPGPARG
jgi:hypothetical protein